MKTPLLKIHLSRMRFIGIDISSRLNNWQKYKLDLEQYLDSSTHYQKTSDAIFFEVTVLNSQNINDASVFFLLPVIGPKLTDDLGPWILQEKESGQVLVLKDFVFDPLNDSFRDLIDKSISVFAKIPAKIQNNFHILFDKDKIELHFFIQKDYILQS